jgi:hypothetical protein
MWRIATSETMNRGHAEFDGPGHQETFGLAFQFPANESVTPVFF